MDFNAEGLAIDVRNFSLPAGRALPATGQPRNHRVARKRMGNTGRTQWFPEYISGKLPKLAQEARAWPVLYPAGKPQQNGYVETLTSTVRQGMARQFSSGNTSG